MIEINPWAQWEGRGSLDVEVIHPGATPTKGVLNTRRGLVVEEPVEVYAANRIRGSVRSADGTRVSWMAVWDANYGSKPKALLVVGYGAYGAPTGLSTSRWKPYIKRGFAIGFAFVRGGGDHTEAWAEEGRREGKLRGVQDFEACVAAMRKALKIPAEKTCLFGRSAGGYLLGTTVARNPKGGLFKYAYTEVPYVDVLKTTSNPVLPLTEYEYREFGDPVHSLADFEFLLRFSPIEALKGEGAPGVFVICRTALNDSRVFAYESFKWVDALRGKKQGGEPKLLAITHGNGHFLRGASRILQQAEDYLILCKKIIE
jgi:oligopeptidase B